MKKNLVSLSALFTAIIATTNAHAIIYEEDCAISEELYIHAGTLTACNTSGNITQECLDTMNDWAISKDGDYYDIWEENYGDIFSCIVSNHGTGNYDDTTFDKCSRGYGWECAPNTFCGVGKYYEESEEPSQCLSCERGYYMDQTNHQNTACFKCPEYDKAASTTLREGADSIDDCVIASSSGWKHEDDTGSGLQRFYENNSTDCHYRGS